MKARDMGRKVPRRGKAMTQRKNAKYIATPDECTHKKHLDSVDLKGRPIRTCSDCGSCLVTLTEQEALLAGDALLRVIHAAKHPCEADYFTLLDADGVHRRQKLISQIERRARAWPEEKR